MAEKRNNTILILSVVIGVLIGGVATASFKDMSQTPKFAVAKTDAPVLHTPDWNEVFASGSGLKLDSDETVGEMEFIALPGTAFTILGKEIHKGNTYYKVSTGDVPDLDPADGLAYWVDARFVATSDTKPAERVRIKPDGETVKANLMKGVGARYIWGGNKLAGIPDLLTAYEPKMELSEDIEDKWMLRGVDCSGFLYEATGGYMPRNTGDIITFGSGMTIAGQTAAQIKAQLKPLDLIVWKGHLMIVLDGNKTIESRHDYDLDTPGFQGGVRVRDLDYVLEETLSRRVAVDEYSDEVPADKKKFVIRRWIEA